MQSWGKGTVLKCSPWLRDPVMAELSNTQTSLSLTFLLWVPFFLHFLKCGHHSQFRSKLSVSLTPHTFPYKPDTFSEQPKRDSKSESRASPLIWPSGCYTCFSLGKLTSNSPGSLAHFFISVNRTHILLLHIFKTEVNSALFPLHPTKYLDGPQFLSKLKFIYSFYLLYGYM